MIKFLKGLLNRNSKVEAINWTEIQNLLNQNNFLNQSITENFFENLSKKFVCNLTPDNPNYNIFFNEFRSSNHILIEHFSKLLESGLSAETLDAFHEKFKDSITKKYVLPGTHKILVLYWVHIFKKLNSEVEESGNNDVKQRFGLYFKNINETATQMLIA